MSRGVRGCGLIHGGRIGDACFQTTFSCASPSRKLYELEAGQVGWRLGPVPRYLGALGEIRPPRENCRNTGEARAEDWAYWRRFYPLWPV